MTQFETIMFLKSPTPSVPIFIAAEVEISVQPVISMFSHGPYSELPFEGFKADAVVGALYVAVANTHVAAVVGIYAVRICNIEVV